MKKVVVIDDGIPNHEKNKEVEKGVYSTREKVHIIDLVSKFEKMEFAFDAKLNRAVFLDKLIFFLYSRY